MNKNIKILTVLILLLLPSCSDKDELPKGSDLRRFDSIVWQNENSIKPDKDLISEREKMLKDLVENVLPGKTGDEIENLLGKSLETSYFTSIEKDFIYYMGPERDHYMNVDSEWLLVWLDESGRFKKYKLMND